jgi:hypothetical protein
MAEFVLRLDLTDHQHPGNQAALHAKVREWLALAMQAIGSGSARKGDLTIPLWDGGQGVSRHVKIGEWQFNDTRNPEA